MDGFVGARLQVSLAKALPWWATRISGPAEPSYAGRLIAGLDVRFSRVFYGKLGYRYSYFDREQDDGFMKLAKAGIYAGLGIRF